MATVCVRDSSEKGCFSAHQYDEKRPSDELRQGILKQTD
jgi:hypothetical protein